ncbi:MAG TPA: hypothetical protein PLX89_25830 [Verrucomicrobiota bacterium]|nr:hypothetical protein [Verrucomicrobiales bacterium]HRI16428.1 hypothetical protein [Verrucomicrobiota bacterium]
MPLSVAEIAQALTALGCPAGKCEEMAAQLDRRAHQLATTKDRTYDEALAHLLKLMAAGWAAQAGAPEASKTD